MSSVPLDIGNYDTKTMVTMVKVPYKINGEKKRERERDRGGGEEWEAVGVITGWWVNKYLNFVPSYLSNHEICRVMLCITFYLISYLVLTYTY